MWKLGKTLGCRHHIIDRHTLVVDLADSDWVEPWINARMVRCEDKSRQPNQPLSGGDERDAVRGWRLLY
jgi:hypothetical protein